MVHLCGSHVSTSDTESDWKLNTNDVISAVCNRYAHSSMRLGPTEYECVCSADSTIKLIDKTQNKDLMTQA